jgi:4-amino-4-deoxychorismate lyase
MSGAALATLVNGKSADCVSVADRGLLYGDGVFETVAVVDGRAACWPRHLTRLQAGCERLGIRGVDYPCLTAEVARLVENRERATLKVLVSRGSGGRGYRPPESVTPSRMMQLHPWPDMQPSWADSGVAVRRCSIRLGHNAALAGIKHLNRLEQVLARLEWDDPGIMEGLLMDVAGNPVEGTMSNLFIVRDNVLLTPGLRLCGVAGIMRSVILDLAEQQALATRICTIGNDELLQADEVFLTNSLIGIWPVIAIDNTSYRKGPVTTRLQALLQTHSDSSSSWRA